MTIIVSFLFRADDAKFLCSLDDYSVMVPMLPAKTEDATLKQHILDHYCQAPGMKHSPKIAMISTTYTNDAELLAMYKRADTLSRQQDALQMKMEQSESAHARNEAALAKVAAKEAAKAAARKIDPALKRKEAEEAAMEQFNGLISKRLNEVRASGVHAAPSCRVREP